MKNSKLLRLIGLLSGVVLVSCGPQLDTSRVPMSTASVSQAPGPLTARLDRALDEYRSSIGRRPIERHAGLDQLAREHCLFMARNRGKFTLGTENISHYGFDGRALIAQRQHGMASVAENLAGGRITGDVAGQLVKAWTASKKHSYNLRQDWDCTGIGVHVTDDGMVYATQIFATRQNSHMATMDRFRQF